ncbi:hypothetical protein ILUMI_13194 [Ignelater luminosus]|uniref:PiggyBac transposable element-derived protein domain-containing protein n=1 Tax=Ignelater luminosus TaxID=2038154 RepID=A0A8K0GB43_IGNLU|nr:hypothetical protein ILUMI_13194 [Ignelater luminosus]
MVYAEDEESVTDNFITPLDPHELTDDYPSVKKEGPVGESINELPNQSHKRLINKTPSRRKGTHLQSFYRKKYSMDQGDTSAVYLFELFFSDLVCSLLEEETRRYELAENCPGPKITVEELKCFSAILVTRKLVAEDPEKERSFGKTATPFAVMIESLPKPKLSYKFYVNNLVSSSPLYDLLKQNRYGVTGTFLDNRIPKSCPLKLKGKVKKSSRGTYDIRWIDNSGVIATQAVSVGTVSQAAQIKWIKILADTELQSGVKSGVGVSSHGGNGETNCQKTYITEFQEEET